MDDAKQPRPKTWTEIQQDAVDNMLAYLQYMTSKEIKHSADVKEIESGEYKQCSK